MRRPTDAQADLVVRNAVRKGGGATVFKDTDDLNAVGLLTSAALDQFQRNIGAEVDDIGFTLPDIGAVPNSPATKIRTVKDFVQKTATAEEG